MAIPRRKTIWAILTALAVGFWPGPAGAAEPRLLVRDLVFDHALLRVRAAQWEGRPGVFVLSLSAAPTRKRPRPAYLLSLVRMVGGQLTRAQSWRLPPEVRWVEPIALGEGREGLWALIGKGWYLGQAEGGQLNWTLLCHCETLFSTGKGLLPFQARFAVDLDGDGRDEVVLPHWRGLMVYGMTSAGGEDFALQPLWRNSWEVGELYDLRDDLLRISLAAPRYVLRDADGDGILDFIMIGEDYLKIVKQPNPLPPREEQYYVLEKDKLPELRRLKLPPPLLAALEAMPPASYASPAAFRSALAPRVKGISPDWERTLGPLLEAIREPIPARFPRRIPVPGLPPPGKKERYRILAVEDMNGDGLLDVVHVKSTDEGQLLDQKNQLRWYEGIPGRNGLALAKKPKILFSEGPAFAELVFPRTERTGGPALFLATTEVSLMAVIRAFTFNEVSLDLFVYPWRDGKLVLPPPVSGSLVFDLKGHGKKNRPMVLLADLDGDGLREYIFNLETDTLFAFSAGEQGPDFDGEPIVKLEVVVPHKPDSIFVLDVDGDGREELLLWYVRQPPDSPLQRTLRILQYSDGPPAPTKVASRRSSGS